MDKQKLIEKMLNEKAEKNNTMDLNAYALGLDDMYEALNVKDVNTRYFFVCTMGKNPNGTIGFNNFDIQTTNGHPTFKKCVEISNQKFPNMREVALISISEISPEDWKIFVSEQ